MEYREIVAIADLKGIQKEVIDKDWILGHFLNAMFDFPDVKDNFIFKGGTCLKKCYFEDYRFSEDLDFTLLDKSLIIDDIFFKKIIKIAEKNSGAKFSLKNIKPQIHNDVPQGYEVTILFWGAYHKPNQRILPVNRWQTKIKLDISYTEKVELKPNNKMIFHSYSDSDIVKSSVPVYQIYEIIAEKLRSLMQRNRPRDIYDLYYLSSTIEPIRYREIFELLVLKAESKNIDCCFFEKFLNNNKFKNNKRAWESSLIHHLPEGQLIDYKKAYSKVELFVENILNFK